MIINTIPKNDGFRMPGEFEKHKGCIIIWPHRPGSWTSNQQKAREAFAEIICKIALSEKMYVLVKEELMGNAEEVIKTTLNKMHKPELFENIALIQMDSDDSWARDVAPTFVINDKGGLRGIDWQFNAWGGNYDGLYSSWDKDDRLAASFCNKINCDCYDAHPFVLEGGSIHSDGQGTIMVTESCLLSPGRNPGLSKNEIEIKLCQYLGAQKVLWLPYGIYQDETNEHVDNVCAFVRPGEVVLAWTDDEKDPQYELSKADYDYLMGVTDARGRSIKITKLPIPKRPVCITEEDVKEFVFEEGEDQREAGERLAASYVNFYISNDGILLPQFGDEHDKLAEELLAKCFPDRNIYPVYARSIIVGGGNIHCITQQIPDGGGL